MEIIVIVTIFQGVKLSEEFLNASSRNSNNFRKEELHHYSRDQKKNCSNSNKKSLDY